MKPAKAILPASASDVAPKSGASRFSIWLASGQASPINAPVNYIPRLLVRGFQTRFSKLAGLSVRFTGSHGKPVTHHLSYVRPGI
jgi:hypothetical protein